MILAAVHKDESLPAGELVHPIRPNGVPPDLQAR